MLATDSVLATQILSLFQVSAIVTLTNAKDILETCFGQGHFDILQVGEDLIKAQYPLPGIYLLIVVYASGIVGLYVGESMRSIGSRIIRHRDNFIDNKNSHRRVYSGSPLKVFAVPLMGFPNLSAMYASLPEGRLTMTPRQLCNSFGSLCEMTMIALFGTCKGSDKYRELLEAKHQHEVASLRGLNTRTALSGDYQLVSSRRKWRGKVACYSP